jgi:endonuclease YncB( thermonuclease family)
MAPGGRPSARFIVRLLAAQLLAVAAPQAAWSEDAKPLWTLTPTVVDPTSQDFQRLPAEPERYPLKLRVKQSAQAPDSATFVSEKKTYKLQGIEPVQTNSICAAGDGSRWPCGLRSRLALRKLVAGKFLDCRKVSATEAATTIECLKSGIDIAQTLVAQGNAFAVPDSIYAADEAVARKAAAGIWRDKTCQDAATPDRDCTLRSK